MGLKESLKKLQENEGLSVKREVKKELTKIKKEKSKEKRCTMCNNTGQYHIKASSDYYCRECAKEYFGNLSYLEKVR
jgi:ribosomal protein L37AE/L43A